MSMACKCDRCGVLFEAYIKRDKIKNISIRTIYPDSNNIVSKTDLDLCENCSEELSAWVGTSR